MATYLPPSEKLPIFDTSVFDETNGTYLTYTSAKKLFLTYPTAQGEETIASLIAGSIDYTSPASGSYFEIGTNQVSGGTVRIGPTGVSGVSVHAGNIDCTNNTINNATDAAANNLSLGNSQTTGVLNIGTGVRATTGNGGAINIGGGANASAPINIGPISTTAGTTITNINTSTTATGVINIGSSTATTNIKGPSTCTGLITASSGVSATGSVSASTSVLTPSLTTATGVGLNIGTTTATSLTLGAASTFVTSIPGVLSTALGTLSGKTAYFEINTAAIPATLDCSTVNLDIFLLFYSGAAPSNAITLNNIQDNQTISLKNWNTNATPIVINFTTYQLYPYGIDNGTAGSTSYSLAQANSIVIKRISGKLYQMTPNNNFPIGLTTTSLTASTGITTNAAITLPTTTLTPTSTQLGYNGVVTNSAQVDVGIGSTATILTTGAILAIGIYQININLVEIINPNTTSNYTTFAFTATNATLIGAPASNTLYLYGGPSTDRIPLTISFIAKVTASSGTINIACSNQALTVNCTFLINQIILSYIKIA